MKKALSLLFAAILCISMAACGGSPAQEQPSSSTPTNNQDEEIITVERINEVFAANTDNDLWPEVQMYVRSSGKPIRVRVQQEAVARENIEKQQFTCLAERERAIETSVSRVRIPSGSNIEFTTKEIAEGVYRVSGDMIADYYNGELLIAQSDKRVSFEFKYVVATKTASDLHFSLSTPIMYVPLVDPTFKDTEHFKTIVEPDQNGNIGQYAGTYYKAEDIANVETLHIEFSDDPNFLLLGTRDYHVLVTLNDGTKIYTEFGANFSEGKLTAREIGYGIVIE